MQKSEIERFNYGLNTRTLRNNFQLNFETDIILQALNIVPEDPDIPVVSYKNPHYFTNLSVQGL